MLKHLLFLVSILTKRCYNNKKYAVKLLRICTVFLLIIDDFPPKTETDTKKVNAFHLGTKKPKTVVRILSKTATIEGKGNN
ncbi:hypothetical protein BKP45_08540 [Anaerobacillus alkalidiazotrophicus]|uniref:Uncharacterized protein n=1 Tax=Anaerobacillus alkalidiazotrophicus TaxID=472963 RepID=A0A1S2M7L7_9BACI|nr:hypothetical protein BKP45_08540 [Anaerobacillus alkalidiazotrophicus]